MFDMEFNDLLIVIFCLFLLCVSFVVGGIAGMEIVQDKFCKQYEQEWMSKPVSELNELEKECVKQ